MNFKNMKISHRLAVGFSAVFLLMMVLAVIGLTRMSEIRSHLDEIAGDDIVKTDLVVEMGVSVRTVAIAVRNIVLATDEAGMATEAKRVADAREKYTVARDKLAWIVKSDAGKARLAKIAESRAQTEPLVDKAIAFGRANQAAEATQVLMTEVRPAQGAWIAALDDMVAFQNMQTAKSIEVAHAAYASARVLMLLSLLASALLVGVFIAWFITRGLLNKLGGEPDQAAQIAAKIASGDLAVAIETRAGDHTSLMFAMKTMRDSLADIVGQVRTGTETISVASRQIAAGNLDLSSRTEEQASSLEETASSMEELTSTVKQNAENARQANQLVVSTADVAVKGGKIVGQVVDTMASIKQSSRKIADIIGVIDGIAFQTNILALNAAVVATEVRNLAQRSAGAAKEIKALIEDSVGQVDAGGKLVDEAGKTMDEIVSSVKRVTDIMSEIAAASQEQSSGIEQVNQAITQMDDVTQQNAALVEEAAAASESLQDQAGKLVEVVSVFKLESGAYSTQAALPVLKHVVSASTRSSPRAMPALVARPKKLAAGGGNNEWEEF